MFHDFLVLGGAGLVGLQVCRQIAMQLEPRRIVVASLKEREAREACGILEREFGDAVAFVPAWGNLFVQSEIASTPRDAVLGNAKTRRKLIEELYGDFDTAYRKNHLVGTIRLHRPEVIVDCVNTATGLSYQNVFVGANKVLERLDGDSYPSEGVEDLEHFLLLSLIHI